MVVRDNLPVELEGIYQPQIAETLPRHLFARGGGSGRVDLARAGNVITATTRGVAAFTPLLSPDQFDFGKPVKVVANGKTVFEGRVQKNLRTLLNTPRRTTTAPCCLARILTSSSTSLPGLVHLAQDRGKPWIRAQRADIPKNGARGG